MKDISLRRVGAGEQRKRRYEEGEVPDFLETLRSETTQLGHDPHTLLRPCQQRVRPNLCSFRLALLFRWDDGPYFALAICCCRHNRF